MSIHHFRIFGVVFLQKFIKNSILLAAFSVLTAAILRYPATALSYAADGLNIWFSKMIPTLFPFMVLSGILLGLGLAENFAKPFRPFLYPLLPVNARCLYCVVIGFLCGFPMGAKITADMYRLKLLAKSEAELLLSFCNHIGPVFFTGFVLPFLPHEVPVGLYLFGMYGIPLCYGACLCRLKGRRSKQSYAPAQDCTKIQNPPAFWNVLDQSVSLAAENITKLGGYMIFFNLLNLLPTLFLPKNTPFSHTAGVLLRLFLEITGGISHAGSAHPLMILTFLPFGGLSCIAQTSGMLSGTDLPLKPYVFHKLLQSILSFLYYSTCFRLFLR